MRSKKETISIRIDKDVYDDIKKDRDHFQESVGGGDWSIADAVSERNKILKGIEEEYKPSGKTRCKTGCAYSKAYDQPRPRLCVVCGCKEVKDGKK